MAETKRERLVILIKTLAHPYAGANLQAWEYEALDLVDQLIPQRPRWGWAQHPRWNWAKRRWQARDDS